jgi:hypothetical protein
MKRTIRRLIISPRPITDEIRAEQLEAAELMRIPDRLEIVTEFRHVPGILERLEIEDDQDISHASLRREVQEFGYFNIHLVLFDDDWKQLGIRSSLWGQSSEINGQAITYGRWSKRGSYKVATKMKEKFIDSNAEMRSVSEFSEAAIGAWHELDHACRRILRMEFPITHYHFYGYAAKYLTLTRSGESEEKPRRYVRTPSPLVGWRALPFDRLPINEWQKQVIIKSLLERIIDLLIKKRQIEEEEILADLQPAVRRKADELIESMAHKGFFIDITSGYRGEAEQNAMYAQ